MQIDKPTTLTCAVLAVDATDFCYSACSQCERTLPDGSFCKFCSFKSFNSPPTKRFFRLRVSIATDTKVFTVICFDRVARVLFGCSADEFFDFAKVHPFAAVNANKALEGELFMMTLSKPKNGNAQHLRVVSVMPLSSSFESAIKSLRELYGVQVCRWEATRPKLNLAKYQQLYAMSCNVREQG